MGRLAALIFQGLTTLAALAAPVTGLEWSGSLQKLPPHPLLPAVRPPGARRRRVLRRLQDGDPAGGGLAPVGFE